MARDLVRLWWQRRPLALIVPGSSLRNRYSHIWLSLALEVAHLQVGDRGHVVQGQ